MVDTFAIGYVYELSHGPALPPKKVRHEWINGEVRITTPADPEKLKAYRDHKKYVSKRRRDAGLEENMKVWGRR